MNFSLELVNPYCLHDWEPWCLNRQSES